MKAAALRGALSDRARHGRIHVVDSLSGSDVPSTKTAIGLLTAISERKHVLVVAERTDSVSWKSLRNVETVHLLSPGQLNTYDVLVSDDVVFTESALQAFLAGAPKGKSAKATAVFAGDLPGSSSGATEVVDGQSAGPGEPGTPGEDLTPHEIDSDVPSVAPAVEAPAAEAADTATAAEPADTEEGSA